MSAYMITFIKKVKNREAFEEYRRLGVSSLDGTNAVLRVMPGAVETLEGDRVEMVAVVEFPTAEELKAWYYSPQYQDLVRRRLAAADCQAVLVQGVAAIS
jgi:uncharacterized protein (DUF1330 family)